MQLQQDEKLSQRLNSAYSGQQCPDHTTTEIPLSQRVKPTRETETEATVVFFRHAFGA